jgi:hypothetical protein
MGTPRNQDKGPIHGAAAEGFGAAYERDKASARKDVDATLAGPKPANVPIDADVKNPDHEAERPAPSSPSLVNDTLRGPGPNGAGNSQGDGRIDPQGQQGSTRHDHRR